MSVEFVAVKMKFERDPALNSAKLAVTTAVVLSTVYVTLLAVVGEPNRPRCRTFNVELMNVRLAFRTSPVVGM